MTPELERRLENLLDRQAILDCIHRYCRGVDRMDRQLTLSVYHPVRLTITEHLLGIQRNS